MTFPMAGDPNAEAIGRNATGAVRNVRRGAERRFTAPLAERVIQFKRHWNRADIPSPLVGEG